MNHEDGKSNGERGQHLKHKYQKLHLKNNNYYAKIKINWVHSKMLCFRKEEKIVGRSKRSIK